MKLSDLKIPDLSEACEAYQVNRLYAFGSIISENITAESDLDFIVVFQRSGFEGAFHQYLGFKNRLEKLFGRKIDLYTDKPFRNPIFNQEVSKTKVLIYDSESVKADT